MLNPFQPIVKGKPSEVVVDYHKDEDKYIIDYAEVDKVVKTGEKDTDFIIKKDVVEVSRVDRQEYLTSQSDDVGILNIMKKVALSGDVSLLNQTHRVGLPGNDVDALGRKVEDIVDVTSMQVDQVAAFESYKQGAKAFQEMPDQLKGKLNMEGVAKMTDEEIAAYVRNVVASQETSTEGDN